MAINLDNNFWNNALANAVGTIIAAVITGVSGFFLFDPLRQWVYKNNPKFTRYLLKLIDFIKDLNNWRLPSYGAMCKYTGIKSKAF